MMNFDIVRPTSLYIIEQMISGNYMPMILMGIISVASVLACIAIIAKDHKAQHQ